MIKYEGVEKAEAWLNTKYANRVVTLTQYNGFEEWYHTAKIDRIAIDVATSSEPFAIIIFNDLTRFEVELKEINSLIKIL